MWVTTFEKRIGKGMTKRCESAISLHREGIAEEETAAKDRKSLLMEKGSQNDKV
jgi:hypothetical protein